MWAGVLTLVAAVVALRIAGPSDLLDNDQLRPAAYTTDVVVNGEWAVQRDVAGDVASKPPLTVWISAMAAEVTGGRVNRVHLGIPSILGVAGTAVVVVVAWGSRCLGRSAAMWAVAALVLSPMGFKQALLARTDSFYGLAGALCGWAVWVGLHRRGAWWLWFWGAATVAVLTKGPVAAALPFAGAMAWVWPREGERAVGEARRGSALWHGVGLGVLLACVGVWVWFAWREAGQAFFDKVLGKELVGHMVQSTAGKPPFAEFYLPPLYFLGRYAPGSIATAIGLWAVLSRPSPDAQTRRFERFLWWWFVAGMVVFCIAPHQRPDLLTPLWAPASLLAGRVIADAVRGWRPMLRSALASAVIAAAFVGGFLEHHAHAARKPKVRAEEAIRAFAEELPWRVAPGTRLVHLSDNSSLQFYLGKRENRMAPDAALELARSGGPVALAVSAGDQEFIARALEDGLVPIARSGGPEHFEIVVIGNQAAVRTPMDFKQP